MIWNFLLILVLVALNGFFVSAEFAVITSRKSRIRLEADEGNTSAQLVLGWLDNPSARDRLIAAAQLGITIVSLALGAVGENTFEALLEPLFHSMDIPLNWARIEPVLTALPLGISLIIVTSLHVVLGEQVPKVASLESPEKVALFVAGPMKWFSLVFSWFVNVLDWLTQTILRLLGVKSSEGGHSLIYSVDELKEILTESEQLGTIVTPQREIMNAVFDFNRLLVRQVMIPRTEIIAIPGNLSVDNSISIITESRFTKFPVYEGNMDNITGIVHIKDLLKAKQNPDSSLDTVAKFTREPLVVPESSSVWTLMNLFQKHSRHIAIVLDEYGGTSGLITLEDLMEEIVGEIKNPFDDIVPEIQRITPNTIMVDGLTLIEDVNEYTGKKFRDDNYDTIAGFFLGHLDHIPAVGEEINLAGGIQLRVLELDGLRISKIQITGV